MVLRYIKNSRGFSLVELLVVMVIMGMVMSSVYALFISNKKSSATSEEVIDVQQNLRVALDTMVADIRMAGFLIPANLDPIASAPDLFGIDMSDPANDDFSDAGDVGAAFTLRTSSSRKVYARVQSEAYASPTLTLGIATDMVGQFTPTDASDPAYDTDIDVIRPATLSVLSGSAWKVDSVGVGTLSIIDAGYVDGTIEAGDMVALKLRPGEGTPAVISYWLRPTVDAGTNNFELIRSDGDSTSVIARYINTIDLTYLLADGTESASPATLGDIKGIRVTISAETDNSKTGKVGYSGVKRRSLQTLVKIRNVQGG